MGDEIRITVIATGFDSQQSIAIPKPKAAEAHAVGRVAPQDILLPSDLIPSENLDVPTFMRRQAD